MKIDFARLILIVIGFYIAQYLIQMFLLYLGVGGIAFIILYNLLLAFFATFLYYPSGMKKEALKTPTFYRDVGIFFVLFLVISLI